MRIALKAKQKLKVVNVGGKVMSESASIAALAKALSLFQAEIEDIKKDKKGFNYSYGDLGQVLQLARPLLCKYGLAVTVFPISRGDKVGVKSKLLHESGEWMSESILVTLERPPVNKHGKETTTMIQVAGSVITYLRRYAIASILGMAQTDDDGALGAHREEEKGAQSKGLLSYVQPFSSLSQSNIFRGKTSGKLEVDKKVTENTYAFLCSKMMDHGTTDETIEKWKAYFKVNSLDELTEMNVKSILHKMDSEPTDTAKAADEPRLAFGRTAPNMNM